MGKPNYEHIHELEVELGFAEDDPAPLKLKKKEWKENGGVVDLGAQKVFGSPYGAVYSVNRDQAITSWASSRSVDMRTGRLV